MASQYNGYLGSDIFNLAKENTTLFDAPEHPSDKIAVKILLQKSVPLVLKDLNRKFANNDMEARQDHKNGKAIIVSGIPPNENYGSQAILDLVKEYDSKAIIIS